jgi:rhodanese-related sulfurtransferase
LEDEQRTNNALKPMSKQDFIDLVTTDQLEAPAYFSHVAFLNRQDRPTLDEVLAQSCQPLSLDQVLHEKSACTQILDVRPPGDFALGHLCESLNIGLSGKFETWTGSLLDRDIPIVVIGEPGQEREAMIRLARVGLDQIKGYLNHGMQALASTPELIRHTNHMTVIELQDQLAKGDCPYLVDVRSPQEWKIRHIDESKNIPLQHLASRLSEIPCHHPIMVYCSSGYRSSIAASLLEHRHYSNIIELTGGFEAWEMAVIHPSLQSPEALQQPGGRTT